MKKLLSVLLAAVTALFALCSCDADTKKADGLSIVCTTFPQYDFIRNILGSSDGLTLLIDNGGDLHSYEPTANDIIAIGSSDLFVYVGGVSDKWVESTLEAANNPELKTVALMDIVDTYAEEYVAGMEHNHEEHEEHGHEEHGTQDEHVWLSLRNAAKITQTLCDEICKIDSANAEKYKANTEKYVTQLNSLDSEYSKLVENSARDTVLFADRFPFRYLIEDYSLNYYAAFAGCSSESEASFQTMAFLIDKAKELSLPVVLTIDGSDGSIAKALCDDVGCKSAMLNSCQSVTAKDIENGVTYIWIMQSNLEVLREALN